MHRPELGQAPGPVPDPASLHEGAGPIPATTGMSTEGRHPPSLWAWTLAASMMAALGAWSIGEKTLDYFQPSEAASKNIQDPGPLRRELAVTVPRNVAIAYGTFGGLFGLLMGLTGGLGLRPIARASVAAVIGLTIGVAAGVGLSFALVPIFLKSLDPAQSDMLLMIGVRGAISSAIGAAAGMAFGLALGSTRRIIRATIGGLIGAAIGAVAFEVANALINALERNDHLIPPSSAARLTFYSSVALVAGLGAAVASGSQARARKVVRLDDLA